MYDPSNLPTEYRYKSKAIKRVPLDMQKEEYERIKAAAVAAGLPVNTWIKNTIRAALAAVDPAAGADLGGASSGAGAAGEGDAAGGASAVDPSGAD